MRGRTGYAAGNIGTVLAVIHLGAPLRPPLPDNGIVLVVVALADQDVLKLGHPAAARTFASYLVIFRACQKTVSSVEERNGS